MMKMSYERIRAKNAAPRENYLVGFMALLYSAPFVVPVHGIHAG